MPTKKSKGKIVADPDAFVVVRVKFRHTENYFRLKRRAPLKKMMMQFAKQINEPFMALKFKFEGVALSETSTPDQVGLSDADEIEAFKGVDGGATKLTIGGTSMVL